MRSDTDVGALVLREAITRDWNGTLTWLREHPGKLGINSLDGMSDVIARRLGDDPAGTLRALAQDGMPDLSQLLSNTFVGDGYGQHDAVWQWLDQQPESDFTRKTRDALLYAMGWTDPDTAVAYLEKLPDTAENRQSFERAMRSLLGYRQKDRFEDLFAKASPKLRPYLLASGFTSVAAQGNIEHVLVAFGGTDPVNGTGIALNALEATNIPRIDVMLGAKAAHLDAVSASVSGLVQPPETGTTG